MTNHAEFDWTNYQFLVTAGGPDSVLQLAAKDDNSFLGLDDVSAAPVTVPAMQITSGTGGTFAINCPALVGLRYQLQYKTNLTSATWDNPGRAVLATNGTVALFDTNAIPGSGEKFYRVSLSP